MHRYLGKLGYKTGYRSIKTSFSISSRSYIMKRAIKDSITLNEAETSIRDLLVKFCHYYNASHDEDKQLELRITGGWVRDKLLGNESHDIDIAINHLSGEEFTSALFNYMNTYIPELKLGSLHKIKKNPAKSKHLETCTTKLFGLDIDFVNLRNEQYTSDSRVPIIQCGTAEEDALRRDATLNSLFYNLNKDVIEDFTGKGLHDLQEGVLRTPLQPLQTFVDDPLRVLRLIRFASKFSFIIESESLNAMKDPQIHSTLIDKISRERVGVEIEKMLVSENAQYGLKLINHVDLTKSIFNTGSLHQVIISINDEATLSKLASFDPIIKNRINAATIFVPSFGGFLQQSKFKSIFDSIWAQEHLRKLLWLSLVLQPYRTFGVKINPKKLEVSNSIVEVILREGLRYGKHDNDAVTNSVQQSASREFLDKFFSNPDAVKRSEIGLHVKGFGQYSDLNIVFNCINDILEHLEFPALNEVPTPIPTDLSTFNLDTSVISQIVNNYDQLLVKIDQQKLQDVDSLKPIIDGKTISKSLDRKPGPWMSKITPQVLIWQLDHPEGTQEECLEHIKQLLPKLL